MNCNVNVFCKMIFSNKFGFILETVFSYTFLPENLLAFYLYFTNSCAKFLLHTVSLKICTSCQKSVFCQILSPIKNSENYLRKSCSTLAPTMLIKLTSDEIFVPKLTTLKQNSRAQCHKTFYGHNLRFFIVS